MASFATLVERRTSCQSTGPQPAFQEATLITSRVSPGRLKNQRNEIDETDQRDQEHFA
jgi:hypothetical protein